MDFYGYDSDCLQGRVSGTLRPAGGPPLCATRSAPADAGAPEPDAGVAPSDGPASPSFAAVRAVLRSKCSDCHTARAAGGLFVAGDDATTHIALLAEATGASCAGWGRRVVPGSPETSLLYAKITAAASRCGAQMPPPGSEHSLHPRGASDDRSWIRQGASR